MHFQNLLGVCCVRMCLCYLLACFATFPEIDYWEGLINCFSDLELRLWPQLLAEHPCLQRRIIVGFLCMHVLMCASMCLYVEQNQTIIEHAQWNHERGSSKFHVGCFTAMPHKKRALNREISGQRTCGTKGCSWEDCTEARAPKIS